jgi:peroxiredoxin
VKLVLAFLAVASLLTAQETEIPAGHSLHGEAFNEGPRQRGYLIPGMGAVPFPVTTKVGPAQQFFSQGVAQLHSFYYFEAERSFRQAAALDPDLALAYWGMSMANVNNEKRAKEFLAKAEKLKDKASPREQLWIKVLSDGYKQPSGEKRAHATIKAIEAIVAEHPDDVEAKAFLAWACFNFNDKGLPISSHGAVDAIIAEVLRVNPMHPGAHHYRIHLWDGEKPSRALDSAALFGPSAPGIAHAWHMPGHIYSKLHRYDDAARQQEASARVDHAQMIRDRTMPYQIHNYVHNNQWCMQDLMYVGRVRDAVAIGENLIALPRHPALNKLEESGHACREGRSRLFEVLVQWELWDDLIARSTTLLAPSGNDDDDLKRLRALGAAYFAKDDRAAGEGCIAALEALETREREKAEPKEEKKDDSKKSESKEPGKKDDAKKSREKKLKAIANALAELRGRAEADPKAALDHFVKCEDLRKEVLARAQFRAGDPEKAAKTSKQAADAAPGQAPAWAFHTELLVDLGREKEAAEAWRTLAPLLRHADADLPCLRRLQPLAAAVKVELPEEKPTVKPTEALGPLAWEPSPAPSWTLTGSAPGADRPVLLFFYLGSKCAHCVQQLDTFASLEKEFRDANLPFVAVSSETPERLAESRSKKDGYAFPILSDASLQVFKEYRCYDDFEQAPLHGTFLLDADKQGKVRIRWQDISYEPFMDARFLLEESKRLLQLR